MDDLHTVINALHFTEDRRNVLRNIADQHWPALLKRTDQAQLTLPLAIRCAAELPQAVRTRVEDDLEKNRARHSVISAAWQKLASAMTMADIDALVLKGQTHQRFYSEQPWHRPQYDIDLYCRPESIARAKQALESLGYQSILHGSASSDHVPAMVRPGAGHWRGDYYAADIPLSVELHFRFWNREWESFDVADPEALWNRRTLESGIPALHPADRLSYAAWHALRHLLRGGLKIYHVYEIAHFLDTTTDNDEFWAEWHNLASAAERVPEAVIFKLAMEWFGCRAHPVVHEHTSSLSPAIQRWFLLYSRSSATAPGEAGKDDLFLHLCLVTKPEDRRSVAMRRLFPKPVLHPDANESRQRLRSLAQRAGYHGRAFIQLTRSSYRWWRAARGSSLFD